MKLPKSSYVDFLNETKTRNCIFLPMNLPFQIWQHSSHQINKVIGLEGIKHKERNFYFKVISKIVSKQKVPSHYSSYVTEVNFGEDDIYFTHHICELYALIELDDEEVDNVISNAQNDTFIDRVSQKVLEVFAYDYNIKNAGKFFFSPNARIFSPIILYISSNEERSKKIEKGNGLRKIVPIAKTNDEIPFSLINIEYKNWMYYLSKAVDSYRMYSYSEAIINCAISFESYLHSVINKNELDDSYIRKTSFYLSSIDIANKLYSNNYLMKKIKQDDMISYINDISNPRNDIVHGKELNIFEMSIEAKKAIYGLLQLYESQEILKVNIK